MVFMSAKFDKEEHNGLVSIMFTSLLPYMSIVILTFQIYTVHSFTMDNMSAKFDEEAQYSLVSIVFTRLVPYISIATLTFDLWPPQSIGFILSS